MRSITEMIMVIGRKLDCGVIGSKNYATILHGRTNLKMMGCRRMFLEVENKFCPNSKAYEMDKNYRCFKVTVQSVFNHLIDFRWCKLSQHNRNFNFFFLQTVDLLQNLILERCPKQSYDDFLTWHNAPFSAKVKV